MARGYQAGAPSATVPEARIEQLKSACDARRPALGPRDAGPALFRVRLHPNRARPAESSLADRAIG
ncbi:MAG TPA: hypothetical protein VFF84_10690 [Sphingobium sp.]|nr:hypothetical protein [Sphingobium sp.]